ncbi:MAG: alkaline phosphatase family protein [Armatimonadota bacterium]|nr:alkaline phosphatase family protein [Armatimonadota bacterium]
MIGIDGAAPDMVERLTSTDRMPTLRMLMRHGVYGRLESSANCSPASAWSSVLTGVNPGKHGVWDLQMLVPGTYEWQPAHSRLLRAPTLPQLLTDRGLEAGTVLVPMTFPAREAEWTTVAGWLAPSVDAEGFAHPRRVATMAARRLQDVPLLPRLESFARSGHYGAGIEVALEALQAKAKLARELLGDRRWDMLAVNFTELDPIQRWYWHLNDRRHPEHREELMTRHGELIADAYVVVDAAVRDLIDALEPSDHLLVVAPYGMTLNSRAPACVPDVMSHLELLVTRSSAGGAWHRLMSAMADASDGALRALRGVLPGGLADLLPEPMDAGEAGRRADGDPWIDYQRSWVLPAPGGHLFLNTEAEFPLGIVPSGMLDSLLMNIISKLQTGIDPATGRQPLQWAQRRQEVFSGPYLSRIPHLVIRWQDRGVVTGLTVTGRDGRVQVARPSGPTMPGGAPGPEGVLIAAGAGVRRGVRVEGAGVEDVAATVMHLCGQRVPAYFDGRVLEEALTPDFLEEHPVRVLDRELPKVIEDPIRIEQASRVVRDHLRDLGYWR